MGLIDRESYVPSWWTEDPDRCRPAGDFEIEFATKPVLAQRMLAGPIEAACRSPPEPLHAALHRPRRHSVVRRGG
jgi:hypothetical protein